MSISLGSAQVSAVQHDFAIIGAGPAGSACANALLLEGASSVALIDRARFPRDKICGDGIGPGIIAILDALELRHILVGHRRVTQMVMTSPFGGRMTLNDNEISGQSPLGYVIRRTEFDHALVAAAVQRGCADMTGWSLEAADYVNGKWRLDLEATDNSETRSITADVLIGADGATSRVRRLLGQPFNHEKHVSVSMRILARTEPEFPARQELNVEQELPIPGYAWNFATGAGTVNVGFVCDTPTYKAHGRHLREILETYKGLLPHNFAYDDTTRHSQILPLASQMPPLAYPDVSAALIGDAASMINPLTGEGIFYGMEAGLQLGRRLARAPKSHEGRAQALVAYERTFRRQFTAHFRGNYYLRKLIEKPALFDRMLRAGARDTDLCCDCIEYMMGNESGVGKKPLYQLALRTLFA
ncbi:NAD(P)/FAD-dependent oxidoreductase [Methyloceanibacter stevinii]|uniref:NAD(P)/FAD-dependent oxidoreductase n=1 Tax=Methyloceanibacter stevinii TaxID=1774970 RepID=UPI0013014F18|nr:NAD(P)/FAD-dependent oxidoreductase [Methyloceanibacter stevinii]